MLYKVPAELSESYRSLRGFLASGSPAASAFELVVADNTPYAQPRPLDFSGDYHADESNPGLAKNYNLALRAAGSRGIPWLLLLDQDTTLTPEFLEEAAMQAAALLEQPEIVALVPRLEDKGVIRSPHYPPVFGAGRQVGATSHGVNTEKLYIFNSGSVMRVSALTGLGGFPEQYSLDFLDHATFAALRKGGGKLFLLRSIIQHDLTDVNEAQPSPALVARQNNVLDAEYRYYKMYGSFSERLIRRLRLLRSALGRIAHGKEWNHTWRILKSAVRLG